MKNFDEIMIDCTKHGRKIKKGDYLDEGEYPIIDQGQQQCIGYSNEVKGLFTDVPAIIFGDHTRIVKYIDEPFYLGADGVKVLRSKNNNADYRYLYYAIRNVRIENTGYNRHFKWLKESKFRYPELKQQQEIASILWKVERIIELKEKELEELDTLIKSRFVEMFGEQQTNPKKWDEGTIRDIVTEAKYGTSKPAVNSGKYKYLRMNNITYGGELDLTSLKYIDIAEKEYEKCVVRRGDVLFNRTNSKELVGKTCVFNIDEEMIIAGYIIRVRVNEKAMPVYLSTVLNSQYGKKTLSGMCKAIVGQANINAQELQDIRILIPPIELQQEFSDFKQRVDKLKVVVQKSLGETQELFDSLMQKYFE